MTYGKDPKRRPSARFRKLQLYVARVSIVQGEINFYKCMTTKGLHKGVEEEEEETRDLSNVLGNV